MYVEGIMGDLYLESVEEVKRYQSAFERIQTAGAQCAGNSDNDCGGGEENKA